ncbi:fimbrial protein [Type-D symbiont of Plautia stali]|uniref:fimbrial protein n=1 Tax=Type-D symbiont of Plautia stali TaxID=1560356 RepID=UPI00073F893B|nr:fimbrial protein [Type-D symbiont of Plautia stali]
MKKTITLLGFLFVWTFGFFSPSAVNAAENLIMRGSLVDAPCVIRPGDELIKLDFGEVIDKYLYRFSRTPSRPLLIHLEDCDVSVVKEVEITFQGIENTALPGLLRLDAGSIASGVAIGIEGLDGSTISINKPAPVRALQTGNMVLAFQAYMQGEPDAILNRRIGHGQFTATTTFILNYL